MIASASCAERGERARHEGKLITITESICGLQTTASLGLEFRSARDRTPQGVYVRQFAIYRDPPKCIKTHLSRGRNKTHFLPYPYLEGILVSSQFHMWTPTFFGVCVCVATVGDETEHPGGVWYKWRQLAFFSHDKLHSRVCCQ